MASRRAVYSLVDLVDQRQLALDAGELVRELVHFLLDGQPVGNHLERRSKLPAQGIWVEPGRLACIFREDHDDVADFRSTGAGQLQHQQGSPRLQRTAEEGFTGLASDVGRQGADKGVDLEVVGAIATPDAVALRVVEAEELGAWHQFGEQRPGPVEMMTGYEFPALGNHGSFRRSSDATPEIASYRLRML